MCVCVPVLKGVQVFHICFWSMFSKGHNTVGLSHSVIMKRLNDNEKRYNGKYKMELKNVINMCLDH